MYRFIRKRAATSSIALLIVLNARNHLPCFTSGLHVQSLSNLHRSSVQREPLHHSRRLSSSFLQISRLPIVGFRSRQSCSIESFLNNSGRKLTSSDDDSSSLNRNTNNDNTNRVVTLLQNWSEPLQMVLDNYTGGWALSYADLTPESPKSLIGRGFLLTNLCYLTAGILLMMDGDATLGLMTDLAAIASFNYHYMQLKATKQSNMNNFVRLSLFLDYVAASISILTAAVYLVSTTLTAPDQLPLVEESLAFGTLGVLFLVLSWKYEYGRPYIVFHSLWHLCSAMSGYLVGSAHLLVSH